MEEKKTLLPTREISVITAEVKELCRQARNMALAYAVEIGRRLVEAKSVLPHGEWGKWLQEEVEFSQSTATNFINLFEEYGSEQISIFGACVNSQTIANLPYTKALKLLSVPAEEREEFARSEDVEHKSVREIDALIKERDQARKIAEMQKKLKEELADKLKDAEDAAREALLRADDAEKLRGLLDAAEKTAAEATAKALKAENDLKEAKSNPKLSKKEMDRIKAEAEKAAAEAADKKNKEEIDQVKKNAEQAEARAREAEQKRLAAERALEDARKQLKTASPDVTAFKTMFEDLQRVASGCRARISKIAEYDKDTAEKLRRALAAFAETLKGAEG